MRVSLDPPRSALLGTPSPWTALSRSVAEHAARLGQREHAILEPILWADLVSEYDARFLGEYLRRVERPFSPGFRLRVQSWEADEALHCEGFRSIWRAFAGTPRAELEERLAARATAVDFAPLAELFEDEFAIACLFAYDELATVRAYRLNLARYAWLGPELLAFVRVVTADEGRHYRSFVDLLRGEHAHRRGDVARVVERIRGTEGVPYANTFVLDHDDEVWEESVFDDAARILRRVLGG